MTIAQILAFLKPFEPFILSGFDTQIIPELQAMADKAVSPDVKVILDGIILAVKAIGDAEIVKI